MEILQTLLVGAVAIVLIALVLKLLKVSIKGILGFIVNAAVGIALIFLLNMIPGVEIPLTWWTGLVSGLFGIPGVVVLLIIFLIL
ncbi:MAG TPA: pro-sigmaK processing inhibitor BofA family protein [Candidatus Borkfalkia faecigallinarum]|uniref:Pro-sigmaK processing inhibitor BofA family protein n=1 Tax=Candidatus Borkfalkia faecigallinarum TaxID=2838509 RepID=A0A9D1VTT5_9FIRM|nr:pro-sigmaK processing inhibitor BofA family protein [Candidatus Borkfalkia faecigallinarum]